MMYHVPTNFSTAAGCCDLDMSLDLPLNDLLSSHVLSELTRCDPDTMHTRPVICRSFPNLSRSGTLNDLSSHPASWPHHPSVTASSQRRSWQAIILPCPHSQGFSCRVLPSSWSGRGLLPSSHGRWWTAILVLG